MDRKSSGTGCPDDSEMRTVSDLKSSAGIDYLKYFEYFGYESSISLPLLLLQLPFQVTIPPCLHEPSKLMLKISSLYLECEYFRHRPSHFCGVPT